MKKVRGSALIIAMLMIASIGSIAFGIARIVFLESNITTLHENSVVAYYAAESGIEEGFLRYRYNMNAEVPFKDWYQTSETNKKYFRTNLQTLVVADSENWKGVPLDPAHYFDKAVQWYDLRMGYLGSSGRTTYYADANTSGGWDLDQIKSAAFGTGDSSFLKIGQDESYKFDLSNINFTAQPFFLGFKFVGLPASGGLRPTDYCKSIAEVKLETEDQLGNKNEFKAMTIPYPTPIIGVCASTISALGGSFDYAGSASEQGPGADNASYYYRYDDVIKDLVTRAGKAIPATGTYKKAELQIKPLFHPAMVFFGTKECARGFLSCDSRDSIVTGPYSTIKSIGYYGGTTKTLTANIDRQSGTLYDLFDYVIYNNMGNP